MLFIYNHRRIAKVARKLHVPTWHKVIKKQIHNIIDQSSKNNIMVDIGGGLLYRRHWKTMDFPTDHYLFVSGIIDYKFDLTSNDRFPFDDNSISCFFSSHTLEHIPKKYEQGILDEIFRCLKPGGVVRLTMPDYDLAFEALQNNNIDFFYMYEGNIEKRFLRLISYYYVDKESQKEFQNNFQKMTKEELANHYTDKITRNIVKDHDHEIHVNWWNFAKTEKLLRKSGFTEIWKSKPQKSISENIRGRYFDYTYPKLSLFVDARK